MTLSASSCSTQIVFSGDVFREQGTVLAGHSPSVLGLKVSTNGVPLRLPQMVTPSNLVISIGEFGPTYLTHTEPPLPEPPPLYSVHYYSIPYQYLEKTGSQPVLQPSSSILIST